MVKLLSDCPWAVVPRVDRLILPVSESWLPALVVRWAGDAVLAGVALSARAVDRLDCRMMCENRRVDEGCSKLHSRAYQHDFITVDDVPESGHESQSRTRKT